MRKKGTWKKRGVAKLKDQRIADYSKLRGSAAGGKGRRARKKQASGTTQPV